MQWWQVVLYLALCGAVVYLAYFTTFLYAGNAKKYNKCKYLSIVDSLSLGPDKWLHIVKAGDEYMLVSACGKTISLVSKLDEQAFKNQSTEQNSVKPFNFSAVLGKVISKTDSKKDGQ